jgi:hypothetical protein
VTKQAEYYRWKHLSETWGRELFEKQQDQANWAARILETAHWENSNIHEVDTTIRLAIDPQLRSTGKVAFTATRRRYLAEQSALSTNPQRRYLLIMAEFVAKIAYNSTAPPDPFDDDTGWYLATTAVQLATVSNESVKCRLEAATGSWPEPSYFAG